ncbi:MAG: hypothetical protein J6L86_05545, partial [Alphaproteobacteria bacterium]|nr:hypothetical protein [Alphaproteobacteria bacterium]
KLCQWDSSYGTCCTASPSAGCPSDYAVTCDPTRGSSGTDTCGYTCYRCCDDTCPSGTSKNYTGSYASTTECGSRCNRCKDCSSGKTYWNGSYVGSSECGSCYSCSDTCSSGTKGSVSCSGNYVSTRVSSTECGSGCYECRYNTDCDVTSKSCDYGCASTNSCGKCTSCKSCSPLANQTNCSYGTETCSNGCGGTRTCCKAAPACSPGYSRTGCADNNTLRILQKDEVGCCGWICPDGWYDCWGGTCKGKCQDASYNSQKVEGCLPGTLCYDWT